MPHIFGKVSRLMETVLRKSRVKVLIFKAYFVIMFVDKMSVHITNISLNQFPDERSDAKAISIVVSHMFPCFISLGRTPWHLRNMLE